MWKYVCEFNYRRNARHIHSAMFNGFIFSLSQPRLEAD
jgi:hypothetical protein